MPDAKPIIGSGLKSLVPGLFMTLLIAGIALAHPTFLESLQFKVYDFFSRSHPQEKRSDVPVVVTLDEKTIREFGQWPWPRYRIALLAEKIKRLGPASIALDIMFPEPDRTSPAVFQKELFRDLKVKVQITGLPDDLRDNDRLLARVLRSGPFVLSYAFLFKNHSPPPPSEACHLIALKTAMIKPSRGWNPADHLLNGSGTICTLNVLSKAAKGSGFINTFLDNDGVIRRTPLLVSYEGKLYPSLAVANLMHAMGIQNVTLKIKADGNILMRLGQIVVPLDGSGCLWISFCATETTIDRISALDILNDEIPAERLKDKMVFLGTTAAGIGDRHTTPMRSSFPGVEIQATVADNILTQHFITRPSWSNIIGLMLVLCSGLLLSLTFLPRNPIFSILGAAILSMTLWWGSLWIFAARGIFISPLMPLLTVGAVFLVLNLSSLIRALSRAKTLRLSKLKADEVSRFKSEFLANMSHEIRTPMNAVIGLSHLALQTDLTAKQADYVNKIQNSSNALLGIINDVLDFSKIEAGKLDMDSVDFQLEDVLDNLNTLISLKAEEKGLEFRFNVDPRTPNHLVGDPLRLGQVLINLSNNAVKFTDQGEVIVALRVLDRHESSITLEFSVQDTGIGLSREQSERLFQPFTQADRGTTRQYGGTGLGLSISKRLVHMMGGEIRVESEPGRGSTFFFSANFKVQPGKSPSPPIMETFGRKVAKPPGTTGIESTLQKALEGIRGARILLVEDNVINQQVAQELLEQAGFSVTVVSNGQEAVSTVETAIFDLVLTDIHMPVMDGFQATARIRENPRFKDLPIVAMTAQALTGDREKSLEAGMNDHITKPIDPDRLFTALVKWIQPKKRPGTPPPLAEKTSTVESPEIKNMPGLNISEGLARVAGNQVLYGKLLQDFAEEFRPMVSKLHQLVNDNRLDDMTALVHGAKGVSGNLGANDLNAAATALEKAIKNGDPVLMRNQIHRFEKELKTVLHSINTVTLKGPTRKADSGATLNNQAPDIKTVEPLISELKDLLEGSSLDADQVLAGLKDLLYGSRFQTRIQSIERNMSDFDYEKALSELLQLAKALGIDMSKRN